MNDYNLELIRQSPINYQGLLFYPVDFAYICDHVGLQTFDSLLMPFLITKDCLNIEEDAETDLFRDIILNDDSMIYSISAILHLFCRCRDLVKQEESLVVALEEDSFFVINSANFDDICTIVMKMNGKDKLKVEKPPRHMSDRQRDVWEKLQEGRRKENAKNTVHIYDMLNVCEFGGNYHIPIEEIEHWTLWKIMNCYKARVNMKTYDDSLQICLVSGDSKAVSDKNHWHQKLLLRD